MVGIARLVPSTAIQFGGQSLVSIIIAVLGVMLITAAAVQFKKHATTINPFSPEKTSSVVQNGVFAISRNPMYLGMLLILSGTACFLGNPLNVAVLIGFVAFINVAQISPEEAVLQTKFGKEYTAYLKAVRRWI
ncbi:MAG: isoprenylcysteine carboxylmethyltransferase family protein [Marinomonas sp.]